MDNYNNSFTFNIEINKGLKNELDKLGIKSNGEMESFTVKLLQDYVSNKSLSKLMRDDSFWND